MTAQERRVWVQRIKTHLEQRLHDVVREGVQAYWPVSDKYDPEGPGVARKIYKAAKKAIAKAMREIKL